MRPCLCLIKILLCPIILPVQAIWIYFIGCLGVYLQRIVRGIFCGMCVCCKWNYKDKRFPANTTSIGPWNNMQPQQVDQKIEWRRIHEICATGGKAGAKLFAGEIEPADVCQGQLGNCWLMSACACLAKEDGAIQKVFLTKEYNAYGKYRLRLWDRKLNKFVTVVIDDYIPCTRNSNPVQTIFAKPNGDEAWVLLLEKAMAKFKGSYAALDGGSTMWAMEVLTGDFVFKCKLEQDFQWRRYDMEVNPNGDVMLKSTGDQLDSQLMFETLMFYNRKDSVIGASTGGGDDSQNTNGIVHGHAYTVMDVRRVDQICLIRLRNPWGTFEWKGNWSDTSALWQQYPHVAKKVQFKALDDGSFWMDWNDFQYYFKNLDFCYRRTGWDDLQLDIHEEHLLCGPTLGCAKGCFTYWCCCKGLQALFFNQEGRQYHVVKKNACGCYG